MSGKMRHIILAVGALLFAAQLFAPSQVRAQALVPNNAPNGNNCGMHLFLPSRFLPSLCEDRLLLARMRYYQDQHQRAAKQENYQRALSYADSTILAFEGHKIPGVVISDVYLNRASMLRKLGRSQDASEAYSKAIRMQEIRMRAEQSSDISDLQASYELARLALDQALLKARKQQKVMYWALLMLAAAAAFAGFIYIANRRMKRLQRELLEQMRHSHESEQKKAVFINSMCHEVRTPLNCVAGFAELLCDNEVSSESYGEYCEIIRENRRQLRYIFDDMLEVARLENHPEPLPRSYMDLGACCRSQLRVMKVRFEKPGIRYTENTPQEAIGLMTSEKHLGILIAALLNNAYKFTQKGSVRISCGRLDDQRVFIAVEDTGCGIAPEHREQVFERFTKLDTFSQGNGLGLYLCRLITRHLGGDIRIDPAYADGTRMVVTLPRK